jgi:hypothetical protein
MHHFGFEQHVPETLWPPEVYRQEKTAQADDHQRNPVADASQVPIRLVAEQVDEGRGKVSAGGDAAKEEIKDDPPAPSGIRYK